MDPPTNTGMGVQIHPGTHMPQTCTTYPHMHHRHPFHRHSVHIIICTTSYVYVFTHCPSCVLSWWPRISGNANVVFGNLWSIKYFCTGLQEMSLFNKTALNVKLVWNRWMGMDDYCHIHMHDTHMIISPHQHTYLGVHTHSHASKLTLLLLRQPCRRQISCQVTHFLLKETKRYKGLLFVK